MKKEEIIALIYSRIKSEHRKYGKSDAIDFAQTASIKIYRSLKDEFLNGDTEKRVATICPKCKSKEKMKIWQNPVKYMCADCGATWDE